MPASHGKGGGGGGQNIPRVPFNARSAAINNSPSPSQSNLEKSQGDPDGGCPGNHCYTTITCLPELRRGFHPRQAENKNKARGEGNKRLGGARRDKGWKVRLRLPQPPRWLLIEWSPFQAGFERRRMHVINNNTNLLKHKWETPKLKTWLSRVAAAAAASQPQPASAFIITIKSSSLYSGSYLCSHSF